MINTRNNSYSADDSHWLYSELLKEVVVSLVPFKKRVVKTKAVRYINDCLRRSLYVENLLRQRHAKAPTETNWETYCKQRNIVTGNRKQTGKLIVSRETLLLVTVTKLGNLL